MSRKDKTWKKCFNKKKNKLINSYNPFKLLLLYTITQFSSKEKFMRPMG